MQRASPASWGATAAHSIPLASSPWTKRTTGPSPPVSAYRMVPAESWISRLASTLSPIYISHTGCTDYAYRQYECQTGEQGRAVGGDAREARQGGAPPVRQTRLFRRRHGGDREEGWRHPRRALPPVRGQARALPRGVRAGRVRGGAGGGREGDGRFRSARGTAHGRAALARRLPQPRGEADRPDRCARRAGLGRV